MSIARKTLVLSLIGSAVFILLTSVLVASVSYNIAGGFLEQQSKERLISIRDIQKSQLVQYLDTIEKQIITFSNNEMISTAADHFSRTFNVLERSIKTAEMNADDMRNELRRYYESDFGSSYREQNFESALNPSNDILNQLSDQAVYAQYFFIHKNSNPMGQKDQLNEMGLRSAYGQTHKRFHPFIRKYLREFGYHDIFIIEPKSGHVVYSTAKEIEFGTSLLTGPFSNTGLATVYKEARSQTTPDFVSFSPFEAYTPSLEAPASFIASPILNAAGKVSAVLAFQLPIDKINLVLTYENKWQEHGLGKTGETYLVDESYFMQSQDRLLEQQASAYFDILQASGEDDQTINNIRVKKTSVGLHKIRTPATESALQDEIGFIHTLNYRGKEVLSAYAPITFGGFKFALVAEMEEAEAFAYQDTMISSVAFSVIVIASLILIVVGVLVWKGTSVFSSILLEAVSIADTVAQGRTAEITNADRKDEFGSLMRALERMQSELIAGYETREVKTARITNALNVANTNMMVVDKDNEIVYVNQSLYQMLESSSHDWSPEFPGINFQHLVGQSLSALSIIPGLSESELAPTHLNQVNEAVIGRLNIQVVTNSVSDESGNRIGTVIELRDRTEELAALREERAAANENERIREALDNVASSVVVANSLREIIYLNKSAIATLSNAETSIKKDLVDFNTDNLKGQLVESMHANPSWFRDRVEALLQSECLTQELGGRTIEFNISPVINDAREKLGTVLELRDRTEELASLNKERAIANENVRIREALDNVTSSVIVANASSEIIYLNKSALFTLGRTENDIRKDLSQFSVSTLIGQPVDSIHLNPSWLRERVQTLRESERFTQELGGLTFDFDISPVVNESNERLGTVIELNDRTGEKRIEEEVDDLVAAAAEGDLTRRINLEGKEGFIQRLSEGLNKLVEINDQFIADIGMLFLNLAQGDLRHSINRDYKGQFEQIKVNANDTVSKIHEVMTKITTTSASVSNAANDISEGGNKLTKSTELQASSLDQTSSNMVKINTVVKENSDNTAHANIIANDAKDKAQQGGSIVQEAIDAMDKILTSSNRINDITSVIDEISFQTNLLALNASVEAARAGEQGRGFAVVAGEVRNLSQRSSEAAKEIKELISDSVKKVETGSDLVNRSGKTLTEIVAYVEEVAGIIDGVNESAVKQSDGIGQINHEISQMELMTQQNSVLVQDVSNSSQLMISHSDSLRELVEFFKVT